MRVLVVEDEKKVARALREGLEAEHYDVRVASAGEEGFFLVNHEAFDCVVLDLMLPQRDGLEVLTTLRKRGLQTPVLILTAKDTIDDRVRGLDSGADDYLVKPFAIPELLARIRALLRRGRPDQMLKLHQDDLEMDVMTRKVTRAGQTLELTVKEFEVLEYRGSRVSASTSRPRRLARNAHPRRLAGGRARHSVRQRDRRDDRAAPPQDRRSFRDEAASYRPWRGIRPRSEPRMRIARSSVRTRLSAWHAGVLAVIICLFSAGTLFLVHARLYHALDEQLAQDLATIEKVYREETGDLGELDTRMGLVLFEVAEGPTVIYRTAKWPPPAGRPYRTRTNADAPHRINVARDETPVRQTLWTLAVVFAAGMPCAVALAIAGGYVLAGRVLIPVGTMAETARRITAESLSARLAIDNPRDEFGRLAGVFNETLARLEAAFEQLRRFTADASHELRTPLTGMRSVGEVALQRSLSAQEYRDVIASMLEEVDRLTRLVENLLLLTRADTGRIPMTRTVVDLGEVLLGISDTLRVLADEKDQSWSVDVSERVTATCDAGILRLGITNLVYNAIKYTPAKGAIRLATRRTAAGDVLIEVHDTGPGIAAADRERIFERFYRVDDARARETGGIGLGLAIARWAVESNGGRIDLESEEGRGAVFRIVLPSS
jgi:heavy metal sensor kinase